MDGTFRNVRALIQVGLAVACVMLVVLWPEWRVVLHAEDYDEGFTCTETTEALCTQSQVDAGTCSETTVNVCIGEAQMLDNSPSTAQAATSSASSPITRDQYATMAGAFSPGAGLFSTRVGEAASVGG